MIGPPRSEDGCIRIDTQIVSSEGTLANGLPCTSAGTEAIMPAEQSDRAGGGTASRWARIQKWADFRVVPLRTILVLVGVVVAVYLMGQLLYRLRASCCSSSSVHSSPSS